LNIQKRIWNSLTPKGDAPEDIVGHSAILYKEKLYIFGGSTK
jgi:hypothetical protein